MQKTTVYLDEELASKVSRLAREQGRSRSELIRVALRIYVSQVDPSRPAGIGAYSSGRSDVSERAEDILGEAVRKARRAAVTAIGEAEPGP